MDPAGGPPPASPPPLDRRCPGTAAAALPPHSHRRIQGDKPAAAGERSGSPTTTRTHGTITASGSHPNGGLRGPSRNPRSLRPAQASTRTTPGPTPAHPHPTGPGTTPLGQINSLAPAGSRIHQGMPEAAAVGGPPPLHHPPPGTPPRTVWHARLLAEQWCWEQWHELHGGPPPQTQLLDPDSGGGDNWKPDKMPYRSALQLCAGLSKAQSSILTQVRTGKIGLAAFLCKRWVPNFLTPACCCGAQWETARHVVMDCPRLQHARCSLFDAASTTDYQVMISRLRPATTLTAWILRHGVLPQFSWAQEQLAAGY